MNKILIIIIVILLTISVADAGWIWNRDGYETRYVVNDVVKISNYDIDGGDNMVIYRIHDSEKNVTCWVDASGGLSTSNGISCLYDK